MQKVFYITVDITMKIPAPAFEVNTNDIKSVKLDITITNGVSLLDLTDITPRIAIRKPDKEVIFQDCEVVDAKSGKVQIVLENQAYLVPGTHTAEIACYKGSGITAITGTFSYKSLKGIMNDEAIESKSEFTSISNMMKDVQDTIDDIRKNGTGIDAKARQDIQSVAIQLGDTAKKSEIQSLTANKADKTYVDQVTQSLASGSPKGTYATLAALQTAFPTGNTNIYLVTADGKWYYWNGSAWTAGGLYQATGISDGAISLSKAEKAIRDKLRIPNISLPISEMGKGAPNVDTTYTNKGLYRLSRWYDVGGNVINGDKMIITNKSGNLFWIDHFINDEMRSWGTLSFGIYANLTAGSINYSMRFYNSSDAIISTHTAVKNDNLYKLENVQIPAEARYIRIYPAATSGATGEVYNPILTFGGVLGEYDLTYYNSIFNPTPKPIEAKSVTFTSLSDEVVSVINKGSGFNQWKGKVAAFLGDSITSKDYNANRTNRFPKVLCDRFEMSELNYGIASSTIAVKEGEETLGDPMVLRYQNMDSNADLIIVAGGTNDWFYGRTPVGAMADRTNYTFYGALHNLCLGLKKKYAGKTIMFMLPIMRRQLSYQTPDSVNSQGKSLKQYAAMIKEVCDYYSIPVLDMFRESGLFPFNDELAETYYEKQGTEGSYYYTHPNNNGQLMMAKRLIGFVNQLS